MQAYKKINAGLLGICLVLFCAQGWAQKVEAIPPGEDEIVAIQEGAPAPFTGQLYSTPTALRWANWLKQYQMQLKLSQEYEKKVCSAELEYKSKELEAAEKKYQEVVSGYQRELVQAYQQSREFQQAAENPAWYRTFWFGAFVGAVAVGGTVATGYFVFR